MPRMDIRRAEVYGFLVYGFHLAGEDVSVPRLWSCNH
jgi:hypothetical protein